jgi:hypothetical protein
MVQLRPLPWRGELGLGSPAFDEGSDRVVARSLRPSYRFTSQAPGSMEQLDQFGGDGDDVLSERRSVERLLELEPPRDQDPTVGRSRRSEASSSRAGIGLDTEDLEVARDDLRRFWKQGPDPDTVGRDPDPEARVVGGTSRRERDVGVTPVGRGVGQGQTREGRSDLGLQDLDQRGGQPETALRSSPTSAWAFETARGSVRTSR